MTSTPLRLRNKFVTHQGVLVGKKRKTGSLDVWQVLSNGDRRRILLELRKGPRTSGQLQEVCQGTLRTAVRRHIREMEEAGLVTVQKTGRTWTHTYRPGTVRLELEGWLEGEPTN
jgi:DNA-binding transcriptional ArsR family regulator